MPTKELSNIDVALFALYRIGGAQHPVDMEDIAIKCWELAPKKFSWKKYPKYPESEPARIALFDAAKPKYGKLVRGRNKRTGWMLTVAGIDYVRARLPEFEPLVSGEKEVVSQHRKQDRYFAALEKEPAYKQFLEGKSCELIAPHEFTQFLRCSLDSSQSVLRDRIERVKSRAREANRVDFLEFLAACEQHFAGMLSSN
ncbi:MAG: hypothetical protein HYS38_01670 [Acidobacteria bacterium]|nr:hypothetical protein [Acidobacteriota bacterium]